MQTDIKPFDLEGAAAISEALFGSPDKRRRVYRLVEEGALPVAVIGGRLYARSATLRTWAAEREKIAGADEAA